MTDHEVIETLARREGWEKRANDWLIKSFPEDVHGWKANCQKRLSQFRYLTSRDALAPVLAGLTDEEWALFLDQLVGAHQGRTNRSIGFSQFILTLPNDYLARAVAEVLKGQP